LNAGVIQSSEINAVMQSSIGRRVENNIDRVAEGVMQSRASDLDED
jgi:hypothetical protein